MKVAIEVAAVIVAAILAWLNWGVLREIKRQTPKIAESADAALIEAELSRRTLMASKAAICNAGVGVQTVIPFMSLDVSCENDRLDGELIDGSFTVEVLDLADHRTISKRVFPLTGGQILRSRYKPSESVPFHPDGFSEKGFYSLRQAVVVYGFMKYTDGFDRIVPVSFCQTELPFRSSNGEYNGIASTDCGAGRQKVLSGYRAADSQKQ